MNFLKQIKFEIKNILRSKFILIIGILVLVSSIVLPTINFFVDKANKDRNNRHMPMYAMERAIGGYGGYYPDGMDQEPIVIDGVTIQPDSPLYWGIQDIIGQKEHMEIDKGYFSDSKALDLALLAMDEELKFNVRLAKHIVEPMDYRLDLAWQGTDYLYEKFIYEHNDVPEERLLEAVGYRRGVDPETFKEKYINITPEARLAAIDKADESLNALFSVVENDDFSQYIDLRIEQENRHIDDFKEQISIQEELIIKNPSQEEGLSQYINDIKKQITMIETSTIPMLQYRLDKNIIPGEDLWQNSALMNIESNHNQIIHNEIISEKEFNKETWLLREYKSYGKYVSAMQSQIDGYNNEILIAERSLEANKPDMKYVGNGARYKTVGFLEYSIFVAMFAVLVGGWLMASEFNQGTIRL
ncbi:MAG TPA: hypothetical protein VFD57_07950, partial [Clostridia bacterium]|nr:hypothetical protein [Clostridia bacterium]